MTLQSIFVVFLHQKIDRNDKSISVLSLTEIFLKGVQVYLPEFPAHAFSSSIFFKLYCREIWDQIAEATFRA